MFGFANISSSCPIETPSESGTRTLKTPSENCTEKIFPCRGDSAEVSVSQPKTTAVENFVNAFSMSFAERAINVSTF